VAFRAASTAASSTGTEPTGTAQNDILIAVAANNSSATITLPSGWTSLYTGSNGGTIRTLVCYVVRGGSAPNLVFTNAAEVQIFAFYNYSTSSPIDAQSADGGSGGAGNGTSDPPAVTVVSAKGAVVVTGGTTNAAGGSWVTPAGFTLRSPTNALQSVVFTKETAQAGSVDPASTNSGGLATNWNGFSISLNPATIVENSILYAPYLKG
jgi:hypothetical protein